jgi:hypothetical protein
VLFSSRAARQRLRSSTWVMGHLIVLAQRR